MSTTLETLELTPEELDACRIAVRKMAYLRWLDAGAPPDRQLDFWLAAENDWIEFNYVPHRTLDGTRSGCKTTNCEHRAPCENRPRGRCAV